MDYETDQRKWKSQLTAALENDPMGNSSLDKWGYRVLESDESDINWQDEKLKTTFSKQGGIFHVLTRYWDFKIIRQSLWSFFKYFISSSSSILANKLDKLKLKQNVWPNIENSELKAWLI